LTTAAAQTLPSLCLLEARVKAAPQARSQPLSKKTKTTRETMMRNEIKIVEDGVIFELEIEEVEEVVAPTVLINP
jgi:hypothetical protein